MTTLQSASKTFAAIAPAGHYVGLRVGFSFPAEEANCLPDPWVEFYTTHGLVVHDPVMKWIYANQGAIRYGEITLPDPLRVLETAERFGLRHGAVVSVTAAGDGGRRSYGQFLRADRPFTDAELAQLHAMILDLHRGSVAQRALTAAEIEALRLQSSGLRLKQIAAELGISISAVKARLSSAKRKLGAQTPSQAAMIASTRGIL